MLSPSAGLTVSFQFPTIITEDISPLGGTLALLGHITWSLWAAAGEAKSQTL